MLAIRNFGHFWSRDLVEWGRRNVSGELLGYVLYDRKPAMVDFREQIGIYVLFTAQREVVYIGQAGSGDRRLFLRLRDHTNSNLRDRWTHFSWFGLRDVNSTNRELSEHQKPESRCAGTNAIALHEIEAILLQLFEPRLNKRGPNWGNDTAEFYQYVKSEWEDVEPIMDPSISKISMKIDELRVQLNRVCKNADA
jgi:hypothetical protein